MDSKDKMIEGLFKDTIRYRVPLYQRYYVWNRVNWEHLWDDIETKSELRSNDQKSAKSHFTGAIVTQSVAQNLQVIIDGQQRLTTFQVILCAIRDIFDAFSDDKAKETANELKNYILNDTIRMNPTRIKKDQMYKLLPREGPDRITFQFLADSKIEQAEESDIRGYIYGAYDYFKGMIIKYAEGNYHRVLTLYETILQNFMVVQINLESGDEYARIFESINGRGQHLSQFDLLRHDLFLRAGIGEEGDRLYRDYWIWFEKAASFWQDRKITDDFLRNFIKLKSDVDLDDQFALYEQYQQYRKMLNEESNPDLTDLQIIENEFFDLSRYAESYQKIKYPNSDSVIYERVQLYDVLKNFYKIDNLMIPLILYIMSEFRLSDTELENVLIHLESYTVRSLTGEDEHPEFYFQNRLKKKIDSFFNGEKSFSLVSLVYLFYDECSTNQRVKSAVKRELDAEQKSEWKLGLLSSKVREAILNRIENNSGELEELEFFTRFCAIWPSAETMLQSGLKGALPIVYSKSFSYIEVTPQLEPYKFITYDGIRVLGKYEVCNDKIIGTNIDRDDSTENVLAIEEILFAFPATAESDLEPHLKTLNNDVKVQGLTRVQKPDPSQFKNWLWLCSEQTGDLYSKHWFLPPKTEATIVTRAGHELKGTLKSFNDDAIYMQINGQVVPVYMHGLYKLCINTTSPSEYFVMTDDGATSISKPEIYRDKVVGTAPPSDRNEEIKLRMDNVLFIHQNANLQQEHIYSNLQDKGVSRVDDQLLESVKLRQTQTQVVTINHLVFQGHIRDYDEGSIYMQTEEGLVILHRRCIHNLKEIAETLEPSIPEMVETIEPRKKPQWKVMVESRKNPTFKFVTSDGNKIQLSEIQTTHDMISGILEGTNTRLPVNKQDILFAYNVDAAEIVEPLKEWDGKEIGFESSASEITTVIAGSKYVLQGRQVNYDDETIYLQIQDEMARNKTTAIVFKHALLQGSSLETVQPESTKITGHIQEITDSGAFVKIEDDFKRQALQKGIAVEVVMRQNEQVHLEPYTPQWNSIIESQSINFITDSGSRKLKDIKVYEAEVVGTDNKQNERRFNLQEILLAYSSEAFQSLQSHIKKDDAVKVEETQKSQVDEKILATSEKDQVTVTISMRSTHKLQGKIEGFDKDAIYMKIEEQTVIVFRHGLYNFHINESN